MKKILIIVLFFATMLNSCREENEKIKNNRYCSDKYCVSKIEYLGTFYDESLSVANFNNFYKITLSNSYNSVEFVTSRPSQYPIGAEILN